MKLKYFAIALDGSDFDDKKPSLVSDFNFQTHYFSDYIQKELKKEKFEVNGYDIITIRGRKVPNESLVYKEHLNSLNIEVFFDESKYEILYPFENAYPLKGKLLYPVKDEKGFNDFLVNMVMSGLKKAKNQNPDIPYEFLINKVLDFKSGGFKNEWVCKSKIFKRENIGVDLFCRVTINYFSLEIVIKNNRQEVLRKEILRTLPRIEMYKDEYKDILIEHNKIIISKNLHDSTPLFELSLSDIT